MKRFILIAAVPLVFSTPVFSDSAGVSPTAVFSQKSGKQVYEAICQGCHMPTGEGATGAGQFPALAKNSNLETPDYPIYIVLHGLNGMPGFGGHLDDEQISAVVNYVRTNFGNSYEDKADAAQVAAARQHDFEYPKLQ